VYGDLSKHFVKIVIFKRISFHRGSVDKTMKCLYWSQYTIRFENPFKTDFPKLRMGFFNRPVSLSLTRWFRWLVDFWLELGRGCFFPLWRLVRPRHDGERAWPLAKMLLGAKLGGRPPIVSRIIVHEYCALWVFPDYSTAKFYLPSRTQERTV